MEESKTRKTRVIQLILFIVTIITTTLAGAEWMFGKFLFLGDDVLTFSEVLSGLYFSIPLLGILTVHEFGHFFTARYYKIKVTLPFYIPMWLGFLSIPFTIGTMGAFIRIKQLIQSRKEYFDVGIAGPLAGFVVALMVLTYGFTHLPEPEYIFEIHPEYEEYGMNYDEYYEQLPMNLAVGDNLLFMFFKNYVADPEKVPNKYELYHYPWLFAGFLALFFTALNLIPIGQLDGGHVIYGLFGYKWSRTISRILFLIMITFSGIGWVPEGPLGVDFFIGLVFYLLFLFLAFYNFEKDIKKRLLLVIWVMIIQIFSVKYYPEARDYGLYMVFAFILGRFLGIDHPKALIDKPLDLKRKIIGWIALGVFVVSFTPKPLYFEFNEKARIERPGPEKEDRDPSKVITWRMIEIF
jgi:membrane-associated protease RseP (regulator of RpoE activity)